MTIAGAAESYTVNFNPNCDYPMPSFQVARGETVTRPPDPTKAGYIFAGWYTDAELTALYDFNAPVNSDISLYGKWTPRLTIGLITNFVVIREYQVSMYTDVNEDEWYGSNRQGVVANAFKYGLMQGDGNRFNTLGNMTIAEAITIAARVHNIYIGGAGEFTQGIPWYLVYVDYAVANGIIGAADFSDFGRAATRAEMAYIFSNALPEEEYPATNTVNALPDVSSATPHYSAILMLYKAGVLGGSDDAGTFNPGANITRAEAAAIISRVILPDSRFSGRTFG